MTAAWMMYALAVGALLAIGAEVSASALRHVGWSSRFVYAGALVGILGLAIVAPRQAAVERSLPMSVIASTVSATHAERELTLVDRLRDAHAMLGSETVALMDAIQRHVSPAAARVVLVGWTVVSVTLILLFVLVNRRLTRARRSWPTQSMHGTAVRVAPGLGPAVLGFLRAEIVVPRSLLERSDEEQRLILAHEREHLCTRDHLLLGGAWLCAIAFPWHPAVWYLTNRVRLAIELDCDARVLRGGASPRSYGALLIDMAARQSAVRIGALALVDGPSHLERRIRAMQWKRGRHAMARGLMVGAMGALFVLAACEAKVPTAAEVASMDVGTVEKNAAQLDRALEKKRAQLDLVDGKIAKADYFVNGYSVSADSARAIVAAKIGSVEVVKSEVASGRDTIFVTTTDHMPRERTQVDETLVPFPAIGHGLSSDATLMIDGVVQQPGIKSRLDSKEVASVSVLKPGADPKYPNGLIAIKTKRSKPAAQPIILFDGRKATMAEVTALPESKIRSVTFYKKDGTGIDPDAANGVISVETRARREP